MAKQKRSSTEATFNYLDELKDKMKTDDAKRRKVNKTLSNSQPELQFLLFNPNVSETHGPTNDSSSNKNPGRTSWKPPLKVPLESEIVSLIQYPMDNVITSSSERLIPNNSNTRIESTVANLKLPPEIKGGSFRNFNLLSIATQNTSGVSSEHIDNREEVKNKTEYFYDKIDPSETINKATDIFNNKDLVTQNNGDDLGSRSEHSETHNKIEEEEVLTQLNLKLAENNKTTIKTDIFKQENNQAEDYREHQDILDSIDDILSEDNLIINENEKPEDDIVLNEKEKNSKHSSEETKEMNITMDSLNVQPVDFRISENKFQLQTRKCDKVKEPTLKNESQNKENDIIDEISCENEDTSKNIHDHIEENREENGNNFREVELKNVQTIEDVNGKNGENISSQKESEPQQNSSNNEKTLNSQEVKIKNDDIKINDGIDDDFSCLMISHSQLLEIENQCYNISHNFENDTTKIVLENESKREEIVDDVEKCVQTKSVSTQTYMNNNSSLLSYQQINSNYVVNQDKWNSEICKRQRKIRAAIQEIDKLNATLLKMRQQIWFK